MPITSPSLAKLQPNEAPSVPVGGGGGGAVGAGHDGLVTGPFWGGGATVNVLVAEAVGVPLAYTP